MKQAASSIGITTYDVNALGQRVRKQNSGEAVFLYDTAGRLIADLRASGELYLYPMNGLTIKATEGYISRSPELDWKMDGLTIKPAEGCFRRTRHLADSAPPDRKRYRRHGRGTAKASVAHSLR